VLDGKTELERAMERRRWQQKGVKLAAEGKAAKTDFQLALEMRAKKVRDSIENDTRCDEVRVRWPLLDTDGMLANMCTNFSFQAAEAETAAAKGTTNTDLVTENSPEFVRVRQILHKTATSSSSSARDGGGGSI